MSTIQPTIAPTPTPTPIILSPAPKPQEKKETIVDLLNKYKWVLVTLAVLLVVLIVTWSFWGSKNNTSNAVRIGGRGRA